MSTQKELKKDIYYEIVKSYAPNMDIVIDTIEDLQTATQKFKKMDGNGRLEKITKTIEIISRKGVDDVRPKSGLSRHK